MAFELKALISERARLVKMTEGFSSARVLDLADDACLLPLTKSLLEEIASKGEAGDGPFPDLSVNAVVAKLAEKASWAGPVAYIEAEYDTGKNYQGAVVWSDGEVRWGPTIESRPWDPRESPYQNRPVNKALREFGVKPDDGGDEDEWDVSGINRYLTTEDWGAPGR